jgi:hypothetical protein
VPLEIGVDGEGRNEPNLSTLGSIQMTLIRMEGKFDSLKQDFSFMRESQLSRFTAVERQFAEMEARYSRIFDDQERRLRLMESKRYIESKIGFALIASIVGIGSVVVGIVALAIK